MPPRGPRAGRPDGHPAGADRRVAVPPPDARGHERVGGAGLWARGGAMLIIALALALLVLAVVWNTLEARKARRVLERDIEALHAHRRAMQQQEDPYSEDEDA